MVQEGAVCLKKNFGLHLLVLLMLLLSFFSWRCDSGLADTVAGESATISESIDIPEKALPLFQLVPLDKVDEKTIDIAKGAIEKTFHARVEVSAKTAMPKSAYVASRNRWQARDLLDHLETLIKPGSLKIIGITDEDICHPNEKSPTWGIMGLAGLGGSTCVISTWRLGKRKKDPRMAERLEKVVVHEVGHTFGVRHCPVIGCIMEDINGERSKVDREHAFCPVCQKKMGKHFREESVFAKWQN
jgi:archaemetzincin